MSSRRYLPIVMAAVFSILLTSAMVFFISWHIATDTTEIDKDYRAYRRSLMLVDFKKHSSKWAEMSETERQHWEEARMTYIETIADLEKRYPHLKNLSVEEFDYMPQK